MVFDAKEWLSKLTEEENSAINSIVAKHKADWESKVTTAKSDYEKKIAEIVAERDTLKSSISEVKKSSMTAEETRLAELTEIKQQLNEMKAEKDKIAAERQSEMVTAEITKVASKFKPRNIEHLLGLVKSQAQVVDGKIMIGETGVEDALRSMKDGKDTSYLFEGDKVQGTGVSPASTSFQAKPDLDAAIMKLLKK